MARMQHSYSTELKQRMVEEIEAGHLSIREAAREAQATVTLVYHWLAEFGRFKPKRDIVEVVMKSEQEQIAALKQALAEAHLKLVVYDELITQANKRYKTDLKKSFGIPRPSPSIATDRTSGLAPSAASSSAPETPTTNASGAATPTRARKR